MTIYVENLTFDAVIGILPEERKVPQKVVVNVELDYEYKKGIFINYAILANLIENDIKQKQYELIEDALLSLHVEIKTMFSQISSIKLKISKPTILAYADVSVESKMNY
ncbi:MAG TPA: dihydroneopterin aldolase [Sulfurospirillum arcachonense]|nr:dihydroneopterin aldolase [Sulfurospirillum arcachonense]HIP43737.1 dihydroneopterin aldolase [Sulfurospirillum arcachonense]